MLEVIRILLHLLVCDLETLQILLSVLLLSVDIALDVCQVHLFLHLCCLFLHLQSVLVLLCGEVELSLAFVLDKLPVELVSLERVQRGGGDGLLVTFFLISLLLLSELLLSLLVHEDLLRLVFDLHGGVLCGNFEFVLSIHDVVLVARESGWLL